MRHVYVDRYTLSDGFELSLFGRVNELMDYEPSPDIVPTNTVVKFVEDDRPQDVVLIIGESMSKTHMSLYGYERETNPSLSAISDTALVVFDNVHSPAYITKEAFKRFMTDWDGVHGAWNEADNIVDMMKRAGYRVTWLSNQNSRGIWDNIPAKFANLSDTVCWLGNQNLGAERNNMDEELLSVFKRVDCDAPHRMTVFHLMGSHPSFERRYPKEYDRFKAAEYKEKPEKNRAEFAAYDNSVLYNDAVVSEIIDCFARRDAIVIYFSDHSLQLCETKTGVMCHAQDVDDDEVKEYAERVPFMIYMSDVYRRKHAAKAAQISALKHKKITTDSLIDYMSTIIGVRREKKK
jgi:heptose-I-phosphate ethanolaminephosphotransferase